jgi:hypothetical protein
MVGARKNFAADLRNRKGRVGPWPEFPTCQLFVQLIDFSPPISIKPTTRYLALPVFIAEKLLDMADKL